MFINSASDYLWNAVPHDFYSTFQLMEAQGVVERFSFGSGGAGVNKTSPLHMCSCLTNS